jgi:TPR repeat protein
VLASCGEEKSVKAGESVEAGKVVEVERVVEAEKIIQERPESNDIDAEAQYELAKKYESGEGVPQDLAEAAKWRRKAAAQGHADAQVSLGMIYDIGLGVPKDYAEAAKWFSKAAAQGNADAKEWLEKNGKEEGE